MREESKLKRKNNRRRKKDKMREKSHTLEKEIPDYVDRKVKEESMQQKNKQKGFVHSIKVPKLYKEATKVLRQYENKEGSLKNLIYSRKYREYRVLYALLSKLINNIATVKTAIAVSKLLVEEPRFDPHLAQILTTQLLVKGTIAGDCKPIIIFKKYEDKIKESAQDHFKREKEEKNDLPRYVRVNTLVGGMNRVHLQLENNGYILEEYDSTVESYDDFLQRVNNLAAPNYLIDYHIPDLLVFPPDTPFWNSVLYKKNVIILQDKASCLPVILSSIDERCSVIDACAAPGNKTSYIAARMNNKGKVIAVDLHKKRFQTMVKLLRYREASCVKSINNDFFELDRAKYCDVEYIFVDPTCSSSGTNVHNDQVSQQRIKSLGVVQLALLSYALSFPSVKEVIYSTCSIYEEENENVVDEALMKYQDNFELANLGEQLQGWKHFGNSKYTCGDKCLRTNVEIDRCTGFFVAKFVKKDKTESEKRKSLESQRSAEDADEEGNVNSILSSSETSPKKNKNVSEDTEASVGSKTTKNKKKKKKSCDSQSSVEHADEEGNVTSKTMKNKKKKRKSCESLSSAEHADEEGNVTSKTKKNKKKKRKSHESLSSAEHADE